MKQVRWLTATTSVDHFRHFSITSLKAPVTHRIWRHKLAGVDVAVETRRERHNYAFKSTTHTQKNHSCISTCCISISILLINKYYYHQSSATDPNSHKIRTLSLLNVYIFLPASTFDLNQKALENQRERQSYKTLTLTFL